jgi:hypothetical protein
MLETCVSVVHRTGALGAASLTSGLTSAGVCSLCGNINQQLENLRIVSITPTRYLIFDWFFEALQGLIGKLSQKISTHTSFGFMAPYEKRRPHSLTYTQFPARYIIARPSAPAQYHGLLE